MMQVISSTIPAHNLHMFQARRASFSCRASPLNPDNNNSILMYSPSYATSSPNKVITTASDSTRLHLANLDKLLQKHSPPPPPPLPLDNNQQPPQQVKEREQTTNEKRGKSVLEGLNLARLWSDVKATEEMSPRHLKRLQRMLSKTAEYSPRNALGSRWREYHGSNEWKGMLDPLDENLRREVVRYGEFIQAAYHSFHSNPALSEEGPPPAHRHVALPDRYYRVTKSLYATSSINMPKWIDDVAPDLGWMTQRSSWIGYVAVCDDKREIARMGRRDIVISLRGTATCLEWAENMRAQLNDMPEEEKSPEGQGKPKVECGFLSLFKTEGSHVPSLAESVIEEVKKLIEMYEGETLSITITGHSLGAALALLVANEITTRVPDAPSVAVFSFGGPKVGNKAFGDKITAQGVKVLRIVNSQDVITKVPGMFVSEEFEQTLRNSKIGGVLDMFDENTPLAYSHVGAELRVDTKMSPFLKPDADMACCHDLEAYLHLVDGFLASNCPFRANAKRSLARLMQDQSANVKKLYISKAKALSLNLERQGSFSMSLERQGSFSMSGCLPSPS